MCVCVNSITGDFFRFFLKRDFLMKDFFLVSAKVKEIHRAATLLLLRGLNFAF